METYFGIDYIFNKKEIHKRIGQRILQGGKGYICLADGVTLAKSQHNEELRKVLDKSFLTLCDSNWVPFYLKLIYGIEREQYSGSDFMMDMVREGKHKMMFLGSSQIILNALQTNLSKSNEAVKSMVFHELPFVDDLADFDYPQIAGFIQREQPDIIWVSLGMPKQEFFMSRLEPFLGRGLLAGVGAAFKFHSGLSDQKRAPKWMIKYRLEWLYRIFQEPRKQLSRCWLIIRSTLPLLIKEFRNKHKKQK